MRYRDNGCFFGVTVSRAEVEAFKRSWPCSGLPDKALWFQFDKRNGDLIDTSVTERYDGAAALALSHDAQRYGQSKL